MAIPDYETLMLPLLKFTADAEEHSRRQAIDALGDQFSLTPEERRELLSSGQQAVFDNRVGWASTYMKKAGLLGSTRRGYFCITKWGLETLKENPPKIDIEFLETFKEFREFRALRREGAPSAVGEGGGQLATPEEELENAYQNLRNSLAKDLLEQVKKSPPRLFEKIVIELLVRMGYGGSRKDAALAIGAPRDEGIDGTIKEDRLGLDTVYVQAKRWENIVGRPEIQRFAGALEGQRARKGIFVTTSTFSQEASEFTRRIDKRIVLIDGDSLTQLMIDHNVGVSPLATYEIKKVDSDYFTE